MRAMFIATPPEFDALLARLAGTERRMIKSGTS
jgi:hypothetical protein